MLSKSVLLFFLIYSIPHSNSKPLEFDINLKQTQTLNNINIYLGDEGNYTSSDIVRIQIHKYYVLNLNIGSPSQKFELMLDTGSPILWIAEKSSSGLDHRTKYDPQTSKYYSTENKKLELFYAAGVVGGYLFKDIVSLTNEIDKNLQPMNMLATTSLVSEQHVGFDGIIGLSRVYSKEDITTQPEFSFIQHLYDQGLINHKVFSFKSIGEDKGKFYIGDYPSDFNTGYGKCETIDRTTNKHLWTCKLSHVLIGEYDKEAFNNKALSDESEFWIDSGGHLIVAPGSALDYFEKNYASHLYEQGCTWEDESGAIQFICPNVMNYSRLPSFSFFFNGSSLKIIPRHLFMQHEKKADKLLFVIAFIKQLNFWLVGQPVFYDNHILFDMDKQILAFTNHFNSGEIESNSGDYTVGIVLGVLACVVLVGLVVFCIIRRKRLEMQPFRIGLNNSLI
jgi:hypothetical protein